MITRFSLLISARIMTCMLLQKLLSAICILIVTVTPAVAARVDSAPKQPLWIPLVVAIGLVIFIGVASFWGSKRGHQD